MKGFLPSNLVIYFLCLRTRKATASNPAIAKTASKPGSVFLVVAAAGGLASSDAVTVGISLVGGFIVGVMLTDGVTVTVTVGVGVAGTTTPSAVIVRSLDKLTDESVSMVIVFPLLSTLGYLNIPKVSELLICVTEEDITQIYLSCAMSLVAPANTLSI